VSNSAKAEAGLSQKTIAGVAWSALFPSSRQILSLLSVSVLARKVPPSAYGVISMAPVNRYRHVGISVTHLSAGQSFLP